MRFTGKMIRILFIDDDRDFLKLVKRMNERTPELARFKIEPIHYKGIQYGPDGGSIADSLSGNNVVISEQDNIICDGLNWAWKLVYEAVHNPSRFTVYSSNENMVTEAQARGIPAKLKNPGTFVKDLAEICGRYANQQNQQ